MNNRENFATKRLIATARELRGKHMLHDASTHFPSYSRLFATFFELLILESFRGTAQLLPGCCGRFSTAQAHVAFL
jgi:hypothetical protein